ncbi:putative ATP-dependent RNA helicase [Pseudolysinimonas kribbensis]|uniref:ATP-dependent RNA helicase n=1 Tax=Pseudolysinimonas kribbensis TaxID=433641 RepID=A0ABQ6K6M4_9MICO|nr:putative ATP-dependent RNA helicase [Pseudolysinimonas kribbensis]
MLGRGRTGSGKTLAFALPMVARLGTRLAGGSRRGGHPLGLVLAPTRELATQIEAVIAPLAAAYGLTTTTIFGGVSPNRQIAALKAGVDIVVACPGRLEDLMQQKQAHLDAIEITVLDEADHMADLGFLPGVTRIMAATPAEGQRMLFSATLDRGVDKLVNRFLHSPMLHEVDEENSPVVDMTHHVFGVADLTAKNELVRALASGTGRRILFMRTKHQAKKLARSLTESGIPAADLQGNLSQANRERNLAAFGAGEIRVLVATDVAARGVHVDDIELVVHVDPPTEHKAYLHRSGRTARAGSAGDVVTVVLPVQEGDLGQLLRKAGIKVPTQRVTATSDAVTALVGEVAAYVKPAPQAPKQQGGGGGRSTGANAQRKRALRSSQPGTGATPNGGGRSRRDRSGRPAAGAPQRSGAASTRSGSTTVWSSGGGAQRPAAPTGNPRRSGRRSGRPAGS